MVPSARMFKAQGLSWWRTLASSRSKLRQLHEAWPPEALPTSGLAPCPSFSLVLVPPFSEAAGTTLQWVSRAARECPSASNFLQAMHRASAEGCQGSVPSLAGDCCSAAWLQLSCLAPAGPFPLHGSGEDLSLTAPWAGAGRAGMQLPDQRSVGWRMPSEGSGYLQTHNPQLRSACCSLLCCVVPHSCTQDPASLQAWFALKSDKVYHQPQHCVSRAWGSTEAPGGAHGIHT